MNLAAIYHRSGLEFRYADEFGRIYVRLKTAANDVDKVVVYFKERYRNNGKKAIVPVEMEKSFCDDVSDWYEASFMPEDDRICYYFELTKNDQIINYFERDYKENVVDNTCEYFSFPCVLECKKWKLPHWANGAIVYQVFPDRFNRGKDSLDLAYERIPEDRTPAPWNTQIDGNGNNYFFGGNLRGIIEKIDYFKFLHVDVVYLTPIFKSKSTHRYDTDDYYEIDPILGTKEDFKELVNELHKNGIRIMLDAVYNHTSRFFFAFQDLMKNGENSKYKDWYFPESFPITVNPKNYQSFAYTPDMPKLNMANPEAREYFCNVGRYWVRDFNIDGWRLDVLNEIDFDFLRMFRNAVKSENPEAVLIGEAWNDAFEWLQGDILDGVMHYPIMNPMTEFYGEKTITVSRFNQRINRVASMYPHPVQNVSWSAFSTHDTARFLTICKGNIEQMKMAVFFQMTYNGSPLVFYGDEVGIEGSWDVTARAPMPWKQIDGFTDSPSTEDIPLPENTEYIEEPEPEKVQQSNELIKWYSKLSELRHKYTALREGKFRSLLADDKTKCFAYLRKFENQSCVAIQNMSKKAQKLVIDLPEYVKLANEEIYCADFEVTNQKLHVTIPKFTSLLFSPLIIQNKQDEHVLSVPKSKMKTEEQIDEIDQERV